ncbi:MAG: hypothetical protein IJG68_04090 [Bacilli bacterium]|nr:hypothetical protein [Bacilli bacterium]
MNNKNNYEDLDERSLIELYKKIEEHITYLQSNILDNLDQEEVSDES